MLEIEKVSKRFGSLRVLTEVSMVARAGRVTAVLGPNAAGKTTLAKIVAGLAHADRGVVRIGGVALDARGEYKRQIGYMPQTPALPDNLTPDDLFSLLRSLRGNTAPTDAALISDLDLGEHLKKPFRTLSGGTKQKVNAVAAFLFSPSLLVLDEPTNGLDPAAAGIVRAKIRRCRDEGRSVLLTSHIMSEIEQLADDVVLLYDGTVRFSGDVPTLKHNTRQASVEDAVAVLMRSTLAA